jgi:hypothetical protein
MLFLEAISSAIRSIEMLSTCFDHSSGFSYHQRVRCTALMLVPIKPALVIRTNTYEEYAGLKLTLHNFSTIAQLFLEQWPSKVLNTLSTSLLSCLPSLSRLPRLPFVALIFPRSRLPLVSSSLGLVFPWSRPPSLSFSFFLGLVLPYFCLRSLIIYV